MAQEVHAETLKKREEDLAQREMLLLGREISMLIQVGLHLRTYHFSLDLHCIAFSCNVRLHVLSYIKHRVTSIVDSYIITKTMFIVKFLYLLICLHCFTFTIKKNKMKKINYTTDTNALVCLILGTALDTAFIFESLIGYGDLQWNLNLRMSQETSITCSLHVYRSIFVSRFFSIYCAITGVKKMVYYTKDLV